MSKRVSNTRLLVCAMIVWPISSRAADSDSDGVADGGDVCCNTPASIAVNSQGRPQADLDLDCDVDLDDVALFLSCATRSGLSCEAGCASADFDGDGDADPDDFGLVQRSLTGPMSCANRLCQGIASNCTCVTPPSTITCGTGACARTVAACTNGQPNTCTPGVPSAELCNGIDDDCDGQPDDGFNLQADVNNCGSCGHGCTNAHGTTQCTAGACNPTCPVDNSWGSCDGNLDNGCEASLRTVTNCSGCGVSCNLPNANESCSTGTCLITSCLTGFDNCDPSQANGCETAHGTSNTCATFTNMGTVSGDVGTDTVTQTANHGVWFRVYVSEDNNLPFSCENLSATITLTPPAGINYDLYTYCDGCTTVAASSTLGTGQVDQVIVGWHESCSNGFPTGSDSGRYVLIEVRYVSGSACGSYTLMVRGHTTDATTTCSAK